MKIEFSPVEVFTRALRLWWLVVLFTIIGGGLGYLIHGFLPPVFSSRTIITTSINFSQTGNLTDERQDQAINAAGDVILSSAVEEAVISQALENGIAIDSATFQANRFSDRLAYDWIIGVESEDPKTATLLTNIWGEMATNVLNDDLTHALKAEALSKMLDNLEACLEEVSVTAPSSATCQNMGINEILQVIDQTSSVLSQEVANSHAIIPSMSFSWGGKEVVPASPTYRNRNFMVLSGLLIGFLAGVLVTQIPVLKQRTRPN